MDKLLPSSLLPEDGITIITLAVPQRDDMMLSLSLSTPMIAAILTFPSVDWMGREEMWYHCASDGMSKVSAPAIHHKPFIWYTFVSEETYSIKQHSTIWFLKKSSL